MIDLEKEVQAFFGSTEKPNAPAERVASENTYYQDFHANLRSSLGIAMHVLDFGNFSPLNPSYTEGVREMSDRLVFLFASRLRWYMSRLKDEADFTWGRNIVFGAETLRAATRMAWGNRITYFSAGVPKEVGEEDKKRTFWEDDRIEWEIGEKNGILKAFRKTQIESRVVGGPNYKVLYFGDSIERIEKLTKIPKPDKPGVFFEQTERIVIPS